MIKAIQDLSNAIKGGKKLGSNTQIDAIKGLTNALRHGNQLPLQAHSPRVHIEAPPRVQFDAPPRVQVDAPPRVQIDIGSNEEIPFDAGSPPRLIVTSPTASIQQQQPKPILKQPTIISSESIANRVKRRRGTPSSSIPERVVQQRRDSANPVLDFDTGKLLEYCQLLQDPKHKEIWTTAGANEFGRLAQGVGGQIDGTNTIFFVHKNEIHQDRLKDVTYIKFVASVRTEKDDPYCIRATLGGNLIHYPDDVGTPTANLLLIKIFLNSVISSDGARFATADLSNFYLMTPLKRTEYGRVKMMDIPNKIINEYKLHDKAIDGWVYFKVMRGMYGLPQAGSNSHDKLEERLNKEGYYKSPLVPALWKHKTRPT